MATVLKCAWIRPNGDVCGNPVLDGHVYCYTHEPLANIRYERFQPKSPAHHDSVGKKKSKRERWKEELDRDFDSSKKRQHLTAKDFPCEIDGFLFQSIQEYHDYTEPFVEMAGTDQQAFGWGETSWEEYKRQDKHAKKGNGQGYFGFVQYKPSVNLDPGQYHKVGKISYMRYCVLRRNEGYYAVWVGLRDGVELQAIMTELLAMELPLGVTEVLGCRLHTSQKKDSYYKAEGEMFRGVETLSRIKERYDKAANPDWIPPNLRAMAIETTYDQKVWDIIPAEHHERLKQWLADGCKDWYGKDPAWKKPKQLALPPGPGEDVRTKDKSGKLMDRVRVWDEKLKQWVNRWIPKVN